MSKVYYHGRSTNRPYYGNYIYITDSLEYASSYANNPIVHKYTIGFDENKLFTIQNPKHVAALKKHIGSQAVNVIMKISSGGEMDWSALTYINNDEFETSEELLEHMGFLGVKLKERPEIESILIFNQNNLNYIGTLDLDTPEYRKKIEKFHKEFQSKYNLLENLIKKTIKEYFDKN